MKITPNIKCTKRFAKCTCPKCTKDRQNLEQIGNTKIAKIRIPNIKINSEIAAFSAMKRINKKLNK